MVGWDIASLLRDPPLPRRGFWQVVMVRFESLAVALREAEKLAARMNAERVYDGDRLVRTIKPSK